MKTLFLTITLFVYSLETSASGNTRWIFVQGSDRHGYNYPAIDSPGCRAYGFGYVINPNQVFVGKGLFTQNEFFGDEWYGDLSTANGITWSLKGGCDTINCQGVVSTTSAGATSSVYMGARHNIAYTQQGSKCYAFGGGGVGESNSNSTSGNELWTTDSNLNWSVDVPATAPSPRSGSAIWVDPSNQLWIFGGKNISSNGSVWLNDMWQYNNNNDSWSVLNSGPPARVDSAHCYLNGCLYLFGGAGPNGLLADMWRYNTTGGEWSWLSGSNYTVVAGNNTFPGGRSGSTFWIDASVLYLFGGRIINSGLSSDLWSYSLDKNTWTYISGDKTPNYYGDYTTNFLPAARQGAVGGVLSPGIYWFYGGTAILNSSYTGPVMDFWIYDSTGNCNIPGNGVVNSNSVSSLSVGTTYGGPSASLSSSTTIKVSTGTSTATATTSKTTTTYTATTASHSASSTSAGGSSTAASTTVHSTSSADGVPSSIPSSSSATTGTSGHTSTTSNESSIATTTENSNTTQALINTPRTKKGGNSAGLLGGVIGGVVGGLALFLLLAFILIQRRKKRKNENVEEKEILPMRSKANTIMQSINNVVVIEKIGSGNFGDVYLGKWQGMTLVALKRLKSVEAMSEFNREATMLSSMNHPNVVHFYGVWKDNEDQYIVCEYMTEGALNHYVMKNRLTLTCSDLIEMAIQIAVGMQYLSETHKVVHRDLSLRNLLVTKSDGRVVVKVSDFGMSRSTENYYRSDDSNKPIRWCAPETLEYGLTDTTTDVYAYGITLWELFSYGKIPYLELDNRSVIKAVIAGSRPEIPKDCPKEVFAIMGACWSEKPGDRPSFGELSQRFIKLRTQESPTIVVAKGETENVPLYNTE